MSANNDRIAKKVGFWDKVTTALTPGDAVQKDNRLNRLADKAEEDEKRRMEMEAVRRRRMAGSS